MAAAEQTLGGHRRYELAKIQHLVDGLSQTGTEA